MLQAFIIVLREMFEAFLIVAIIVSYLRKTRQDALLSSVRWGVAASVLLSGLFGYLLMQGVNTPLWEGITGLVAAVFVFFLVIHMWRRAPYMKKDMEAKLSSASLGKPLKRAFLGVFLFTAFMITREGMETALLIFQVRQPGLVTGMIFGVLAAGVLSFLWVKLGHLINLKLFFQVTALFLLLFVGQILLFSFHEFTEAGIFPNSEALHIATEPYSPDGVYGRWISLSIVLVCSVWLFTAWIRDFISRKISISEK